MKMLSWNVRRANNSSKQWRISEDSCVIDQTFGANNTDFTFSPFLDSSRSIICCWNSARFIELAKICQPRMVVIKGSWIGTNVLKGLFCIYASENLHERSPFFRSIISFVDNWDC